MSCRGNINELDSIFNFHSFFVDYYGGEVCFHGFARIFVEGCWPFLRRSAKGEHAHSRLFWTHSPKSLHSTPSTSLHLVLQQFCFCFGACLLLGEKPRPVLTSCRRHGPCLGCVALSVVAVGAPGLEGCSLRLGVPLLCSWR